uniref:Armadillo repeat-containing domain-containing protein n=1 Tax=Anopheles arabiensis TaxID=7173 RepID=A0A182HZ70_ANOAR
MFSTQERLKRKTPAGGINRRAYLCLLVDEYYETSNLEAQQQVTANLANFAYDPINWTFLREAKAHELFYDIVQQSTGSVVDRLLLLHAIVGLANISLDPAIAEFIERSNGYDQLRALLEKYQTDCEIVCNALTCYSFLLNDTSTDQLKQDKGLVHLLERFKRSGNPRIANLATVLVADLQ